MKEPASLEPVQGDEAEVLLHILEHNGHADLLREAVDGRTGW